MSVFVKDFDLPQTCYGCEFMYVQNKHFMCGATKWISDSLPSGRRADWCPLEDADEVCMKHYKQGRLDEAAEREGRLIQAFSPD